MQQTLTTGRLKTFWLKKGEDIKRECISEVPSYSVTIVFTAGAVYLLQSASALVKFLIMLYICELHNTREIEKLKRADFIH